jgi:acylphosphatase
MATQHTNIARARVLIDGRVQGVSFRANTRDEARRAGVTGWVRNLEDRRVEALFEGPRPAVQHMIDWCRRGAAPARVTNIEIHWEPPTGAERGFQIVW